MTRLLVSHACRSSPMNCSCLFGVALAIPVVDSLSPSSLPPASFSWLTIRGSGFGAHATDLLDILLVEVDSTTVNEPNIYRCTGVQWIDDTRAMCVPPPILPAASQYGVQVNVSHALSTRPTIDDDDAILRIDCYASRLCATCWTTRPDGSRGDTTSSDSRALGMDEPALLALLLIGLVCAIVVVGGIAVGIILMRVARRRPRDTRKVGQSSMTHISERDEGGGSIGAAVTAAVTADATGAKTATEPDEEPVTIPSGVMISYSHANTPFALRMEEALVAAGFTVWIDTKITPGEDWRSNIAEAIELSFAVVVVLSPTSVTSKYCKVSATHTQHRTPRHSRHTWARVCRTRRCHSDEQDRIRGRRSSSVSIQRGDTGRFTGRHKVRSER
jgi:hypothetical protein